MRTAKSRGLFIGIVLVLLLFLLVFFDASWGTKLRATAVGFTVALVALAIDVYAQRRRRGWPNLRERIRKRAEPRVPPFGQIDPTRPLLAVACGAPAADWIYLVNIGGKGEVTLVPLDGPGEIPTPPMVEVGDWAEFRNAVRAGRFEVLPQSDFADEAARRLAT